jgi:GNAT superfamily N-acetyltransferase
VIAFRRARAEDADAVERLYRLLVDQADVRVTADSVAALEDDATNLLVVGTRGAGADVVATALLVICRDVMYGGDQPFAVIENVIVDPGARGAGVGAALMAHLAAECRARRCTKIMLLSGASRAEAHRFFERCGYRGDVKRGFVAYLNR